MRRGKLQFFIRASSERRRGERRYGQRPGNLYISVRICPFSAHPAGVINLLPHLSTPATGVNTYIYIHTYTYICMYALICTRPVKYTYVKEDRFRSMVRSLAILHVHIYTRTTYIYYAQYYSSENATTRPHLHVMSHTLSKENRFFLSVSFHSSFFFFIFSLSNPHFSQSESVFVPFYLLCTLEHGKKRKVK